MGKSDLFHADAVSKPTQKLNKIAPSSYTNYKYEYFLFDGNAYGCLFYVDSFPLQPILFGSILWIVFLYVSQSSIIRFERPSHWFSWVLSGFLTQILRRFAAAEAERKSTGSNIVLYHVTPKATRHFLAISLWYILVYELNYIQNDSAGSFYLVKFSRRQSGMTHRQYRHTLCAFFVVYSMPSSLWPCRCRYWRTVNEWIFFCDATKLAAQTPHHISRELKWN